VSTVTMAPVEPAWTIQDVSKYLRVCEATIRVWMKTGKVPAPRRIGAKYLWDPAEIRALVISQSDGA
jgi:hypothetical protein